jgi:hypothetical protein
MTAGATARSSHWDIRAGSDAYRRLLGQHAKGRR